MSRTLTVLSALVPPDQLLHGRVNVQRLGADHFEIRFDQECIDSSVLSEIQTQIQKAIVELSEILIPGVIPMVTCHPANMNRLVDIEPSPHLISIYLRDGAMPQDLADELAAAVGYIVRQLQE